MTLKASLHNYFSWRDEPVPATRRPEFLFAACEEQHRRTQPAKIRRVCCYNRRMARRYCADH